MKVPRKDGEQFHPLWHQLVNLQVKLAQNLPLDAAENAWLLELLGSIGEGEDVSKRFLRNVKPSEDEKHYFIAIDVARLKRENDPDPYATAGKRWFVAPESIPVTLSRKKIKDVPVVPLNTSIRWAALSAT